MKIIIINGITGTIGNALFETYICEPDTLIIGLSRQGVKLPPSLNHHMILKVNFDDQKELDKLGKLIYSCRPTEIIYFHCIGRFKTELDPQTLSRKVEIDHDQDGLDDEIVRDVNTYFEKMSQSLLKYRPKKTYLTLATIGSVAEDHDIEIFQSWIIAKRQALEKIKRIVSTTRDTSLYNILISTLLSSKEMVARPYVFGTDANPKYWLKPLELAKKIKKEASKRIDGYHCIKIFKHSPNFSKNHFENQRIKDRRLYELYGKEYK